MVASVNTNFIVQNGLTAGPATIFAGNGDVITSGNITVTGGGSFGGCLLYTSPSPRDQA